MAEVFKGVEAARSYTGEGIRANPCLAVDLAMLGVGTIEECHDVLVASGISTADGMSQLPDDGGEVSINGNKVVFRRAQMRIDASRALGDAASRFNEGDGTLVAVRLNEEDPNDGAMHIVLLAGQFEKDGKPGDILVGDSLQDGMQREPAQAVYDRLQQTIEWAGGLLSYHVSVIPEEQPA